MINAVRIKEVGENVVLRKEDFESLIWDMESLMEQIRESEKDTREGDILEIKTEDGLNNLFVE